MKSDINDIFKEIYEKESDAIFRFCHTRISDHEQALDTTQETFLRLWQSLQEDKEILNMRAFLYTVARRLIIDWYRKKKSIAFKDMAYDEEDALYDPMDETSLDKLNIGIEGRYLLTKINELSGGEKDPVYLRFVEDLSPGEIGEILGISANAASVRINRGLTELRKKAGYDKENK